jgi:riboflavin synthase
MFTGIVETTGEVLALDPYGSGRRLTLRHPLEGLRESDSIAVNGVCLTVLAPRQNTFHADLSPETLSRTNLGALAAGSLVNLERPMTPQTRLSGHFVQGHVDGLAEVVALERLDAEGNHTLKVRVPLDLYRYVAFKGSISLDGISLTVASLEKDIAGIAIIPFTFSHTNLCRRAVGESMNVEVDLIARYLERLLRPDTPASGLTVERLIQEGF